LVLDCSFLGMYFTIRVFIGERLLVANIYP
jgi:hypothetical protein